jgi:hypothetical protein
MPSPEFRTAALVTVEENQDAFVVGLSENPTGDGAYLVFQCALTPPDAQDAATGLDTYCLLDEDGAVQYGGVTSAGLEGTTLTLTLTDEAADELGVENETRSITIDVPAPDAPGLAAGLRRIFSYGSPANRPQLTGI